MKFFGSGTFRGHQKKKLSIELLNRGYGLLLDPPQPPGDEKIRGCVVPTAAVSNWTMEDLEGLRVLLFAGTAHDCIEAAMERLLRFVEINAWQLKRRFRKVWKGQCRPAFANIMELLIRYYKFNDDPRFLNASLKMKDMDGLKKRWRLVHTLESESMIIELCRQRVGSVLGSIEIFRVVK